MPTEAAAEDQADMIRLAEGQDAALNRLMERHGNKLLHFLVRLLQNETEAADLTQETFVRVYLNRRRFNARQRFTTWLYAIATNLVRDRVRWRKRHPTVSIGDRAADTGVPLQLIQEGRTPAEAADASERVGAVRRAVAALPDEMRTPLVLAEYEGLSQAEIGAILGCSAKAVELRIYRARHRLREQLALWLD